MNSWLFLIWKVWFVIFFSRQNKTFPSRLCNVKQRMGAITQENLSLFAFDDLGPVLTPNEPSSLRRKSIELLREQHFTPSQKTVTLNKLQLEDFNALKLIGQGGYGKVKGVVFSVIFPQQRSSEFKIKANKCYNFYYE